MSAPHSARFPRLPSRLGRPLAVRLATGAAAVGVLLWISNCRVNRLLGSAGSTGPFAVSPAQIRDSALAGSDTIRRRTLLVSSSGPWRASAAEPWITIQPPTGSSGGPIALSLNPGELGPGSHEGTVTVTPAQQGSEPARVEVAFVIQQPVLAVEPREVSRSTRSETEFRDTLRVRNTGTGPLVWSARANGPRGWLTLEDSTGLGDGIIPIRLSTRDLRHRTYETTIVITAPGAKDSPATVKIKLQRRRRGGDDDDDDDEHDDDHDA